MGENDARWPKLPTVYTLKNVLEVVWKQGEVGENVILHSSFNTISVQHLAAATAIHRKAFIHGKYFYVRCIFN